MNGESFNMFGWGSADVPLLLAAPLLVVASGFFSGSETALFGLSESQRLRLRHEGGIAGRAVGALLTDQRMLLITLLLGNMSVNVLYFVISSVLMMRAEVQVVGSLVLALASLLLIVLFGEVTPKIIANTRRESFTRLAAPLLLAIHRIIGPLRIPISRFVVSPLNRLTAPRDAPPPLTAAELQALLEDSAQRGVFDADEQRVLREVLDFRSMRVRDAMTPRVEIRAVPADASREDVIEAIRGTTVTVMPVYEGDLDHIVGMLHCARYLLAGDAARLAEHMKSPRFVPETSRLDTMLDHFRQTKTSTAIVVDEYGGTEGIISIRDVVAELIGGVDGPLAEETAPPKLVANGVWLVDARMNVHEWAEAFGHELASPRVATLGGLILEHLGRAAVVGDRVTIDNVMLEVIEIDAARIVEVRLTLIQPDEEE